MSYDISSWGVQSTPSVMVTKTLECLRALKEDGIVLPSMTNIYSKTEIDNKYQNPVFTGSLSLDSDNQASIFTIYNSGVQIGSIGKGNYAVNGADSLGISFQSNGAMSFASGGSVEKMRLTTTGLGIGIINPAYKFDVQGDSLNWTSRISGWGVAGSSYGLFINAGSNATDSPFHINDVFNLKTLFCIKGDGKTGVGTPNPTNTLHLCDYTDGGITLERSHGIYPSKWSITPGYVGAYDLAFKDLLHPENTPLTLKGNSVGVGGVLDPKANLHSTGSTILGCPPIHLAPADNSIGNSQMSIWIDQTTNKLKLSVRNSNGIIQTTTLAFDI